MPPPIVLAQAMQNGLLLSAVLSIAAGIIILLVPRALNYVVAVYLIVVGVLQLIAAL